ncbi:MAG TPA: hypothetical protein PKH92_08330 [Anaerolineaceae bacterium]|nr:hypothetical protein [Anaerolineaceae bacterium]
MTTPPAPLDLHTADIQYLPQHRCPACGAAPAAAPDGAWFQPYQDWYGTALRFWSDHLGYLRFQCACQHAPGFAPGMLRAARLGDAVIPLVFDDGALARQHGLPPAQLNARRVSQAVAFLARHADPARTAGADALAHTLYAVSAGALSPDQAKREIERWLAQQALVDLDVLSTA